jgi:hypothetical protein
MRTVHMTSFVPSGGRYTRTSMPVLCCIMPQAHGPFTLPAEAASCMHWHAQASSPAYHSPLQVSARGCHGAEVHLLPCQAVQHLQQQEATPGCDLRMRCAPQQQQGTSWQHASCMACWDTSWPHEASSRMLGTMQQCSQQQKGDLSTCPVAAGCQQQAGAPVLHHSYMATVSAAILGYTWCQADFLSVTTAAALAACRRLHAAAAAAAAPGQDV